MTERADRALLEPVVAEEPELDHADDRAERAERDHHVDRRFGRPAPQGPVGGRHDEEQQQLFRGAHAGPAILGEGGGDERETGVHEQGREPGRRLGPLALHDQGDQPREQGHREDRLGQEDGELEGAAEGQKARERRPVEPVVAARFRLNCLGHRFPAREAVHGSGSRVDGPARPTAVRLSLSAIAFSAAAATASGWIHPRQRKSPGSQRR